MSMHTISGIGKEMGVCNMGANILGASKGNYLWSMTFWSVSFQKEVWHGRHLSNTPPAGFSFSLASPLVSDAVSNLPLPFVFLRSSFFSLNRLIRFLLQQCNNSWLYCTLRTQWSWQKYCLNHCVRMCCSLRIVTRCRFTNWRIRCKRGGRNVHFLSINFISFRRSRGVVLVMASPGAGDGRRR